MHASRGWTYLNRHNPEQAILEFQQADELPGALLGLSVAYFDRGDFKQSEAYLDEAVRRYPNDWAVHYDKGLRCLAVAKDYDCAVRHFEWCKSLRPAGIIDELDALIQEAQQEQQKQIR